MLDSSSRRDEAANFSIPKLVRTGSNEPARVRIQVVLLFGGAAEYRKVCHSKLCTIGMAHEISMPGIVA